MPSSNSSRDVMLEQLAADFVERHRQGMHPPLSEYTDRYPDLAADIRDLFPALVQIEKLKPPADATDATDGFERQATPALANLERLGDYRILREVGRGGMGVVYEAEQESLGRHVALKVLPSSALLNPTYLARFRREAQAAGRLHHTNIVPVFGVGECGGVHYYAMQFIQGEGLDKVLADVRRLRQPPGAGEAPPPEGSVAHTLLNGQFDPPVAADPGKPNQHPDSSSLTSRLSPCGPEAEYFRGVARIGVQVADALAYAHRQGILHRDVKPSNLLLDLQGIGVGRRLRAGQGRGDGGADAHRRHRRHDPLHGPRAVRRRVLAAERRLWPGPDALRAADTPAGVRRHEQGPAHRPGAERAAPAAVQARPAGPARSGDARAEVPG